MWVKLPALQTGRNWLFGIFRYIFNLKSVIKNEKERGIQADFGNILTVLLVIRDTELNPELQIIETRRGQ